MYGYGATGGKRDDGFAPIGDSGGLFVFYAARLSWNRIRWLVRWRSSEPFLSSVLRV